MSPCSETALATESVDVNKTINRTHSNIQFEIADSIVADSLEIKHDSAGECDVEPKPKQKRHELINTVENVADSLHVSLDSQMAGDETHGCEGKEKKTDKQIQSAGAENQAKHLDTAAEQSSTEKTIGKLFHKTRNKQLDEAKHSTDLHVPAGFLCSRIPRKVWK